LDLPGPDRIFAVLALARTDGEAAAILADVVRRATDFTAAERAQAARGLEQFGSGGQRLLRDLLKDLMPASGPVAATTLVGDHFGVLLTVVSSLDSVGRARTALRRLAELPAGPELPRPIRLRVSLLRCAAAQLLAERNYGDPLLTGCDVTEPSGEPPAPPDLPPLAARAVVQALGMEGVKIRGARLSAWRAYAKAADPGVRAAAIALLGAHHEIDDSALSLAEALRSETPGVVTAAAQVITKVPLRAALSRGKSKSKPTAPHPDVVSAIVQRLDGRGPTADIEALGAVIDAAGALVLADADPPLRKLCRSPRPTVRQRAQVALGAIAGRGQKIVCAPPPDGLPLPQELDGLVDGEVEVVLQTDAGELALRLDPSFAPAAVTRIAQLVESGFYDGMAVHRVVPGFVAQFGSPTGDGFGPTDRPALPCETSPLPFSSLTVGVALAGRDTGSTQLFVTHASVPRLDGQYAWLGTASGPWGSVAAGDVIRKATLSE
jgi:cyclophilin family peptidyl-prolyl cis-trans isomerase